MCVCMCVCARPCACVCALVFINLVITANILEKKYFIINFILFLTAHNALLCTQPVEGAGDDLHINPTIATHLIRTLIPTCFQLISLLCCIYV